jgi:hypothetical protein
MILLYFIERLSLNLTCYLNFSGIDKLTIDTESTATLVNEDHAFIPDNMTNSTLTEPYLLHQ